jgi:uncharacterized protein YcfL
MRTAIVTVTLAALAGCGGAGTSRSGGAPNETVDVGAAACRGRLRVKELSINDSTYRVTFVNDGSGPVHFRYCPVFYTEEGVAFAGQEPWVSARLDARETRALTGVLPFATARSARLKIQEQ